MRFNTLAQLTICSRRWQQVEQIKWKQYSSPYVNSWVLLLLKLIVKAYVFLFRVCPRFRKISHFTYCVTTKIISQRMNFFRRPKISMTSNLQASDLPVVNSLSYLCCYTYMKCSTIESKLLPLLSVSVPFLKTNSYEKKSKNWTLL